MFGITQQDIKLVKKLHAAGLSIEDARKAVLNVDAIEKLSIEELKKKLFSELKSS